MNFIDWCETVLRKMIELGQTALEAQSLGIDQDALNPALFGTESELQGYQFQALLAATNELKMLGLIRQLGENSAIWEVTEAGQRHAKAIRLLWRDICAIDLQFLQQRELLKAVNQLSQQTQADCSWLEYVESETLRAELAWTSDWVQFRAAAFRLADLGFVVGNFMAEAIDLRATYSGLAWETRCVKSKLFISYRRAPSEAYALLLSEKLSPYGMNVFVDTLTVESAELFPARLEKGIADCDVFVALLAPSTLESEWVLREIQKADALGKPMIPVFQPDFIVPNSTDVPGSVAKLLAFEGIKINSGYVNEAFDKLVAMIERTWFRQFVG